MRNLSNARDLHSGVRWIAVKNDTAEEIPAFAVMRVSGRETTGEYKVAMPNADSQTGCLINGPVVIPVAKYGQALDDFPWAVLYDTGDGTPAVGEAWGPGNGSWKLRKGKTGYQIYGGHTDGRVEVTKVGSTEGSGKPLEYWRHVGDKFYHFSPHMIRNATDTLSANILYLAPYTSMRGGTLDRLAVYVGAAPAFDQKVRLGIYNSTSDTDVTPSSLLIDAGELTLTSSSTNVRSKTISQALTANKLYWLALLTDTTLNGAALMELTSDFFAGVFGIEMSSNADGAFFTTEGAFRRVNQTYGALPDPAPSLSGTDLYNEGPAVLVRYSG